MRWTPAQLADYEARRRVEDRNALVADPTPTPDLESKLHERIMEYCDHQWPKWKYIHARMDRKSTVAVGSQDFTIFLPGGRTLCIECKAQGRKRSPAQLAWALEMERLGHTVHLVESEDGFLQLLRVAGVQG